MTRILILEATPIDPTTELNVTIKLRSALSANEDAFADYEPSLLSDFTSGATFSRDGILSTVSASYSNITFDISENLAWANYAWSGCLAQLYVAESGQPKSSWTPIYFGEMGPLAVEGLTASLPLTGSESALTKPLVSSFYAGTGGVEGPAEMKGTPKPYLMGSALNVTPVCIDYAQQIYQVHSGAATVSNVFEGALSLGASTGNAPDFATLIGTTLTDGQWITCNSLGLFRLASEPTYMVTVDAVAQSDASVGNLAKVLLNAAGVINSRIDTSITSIAEDWSYYTTEDVSIGDVLRAMMADVGYYILTNALGQFIAGEYYSTRSSIPVLEDSSLEDTKIISAKTLAATSPIWRLRYGHSRNFTEMTLDDIAAAVGEDAGVDQAARDAAQDALDAAIAAQSAADLASGRLDAMANDAILDRAEKRNIVMEFEALTAEKAGIVARATALSLSAVAYNNAYTVLNGYLTGLSPSWSDTSVDTPIVAATFKSNWLALLAAKQDLLNAIYNAAAQTAGWSNVTNRPTTLSALDSVAGTKLNTIETGATVGAPSGTPVGSRTADEINTMLTDARADMDELFDVYGDTVAASAARDAAVAARDAAELHATASAAQATFASSTRKITNATVASQFPKAFDPDLFTTLPNPLPAVAVNNLEDQGLGSWIDANRASVTMASANYNLYHRGLIKWETGRTYRIHADVEIVSAPAIVQTALQGRLIDSEFTTSTSLGWWSRTNSRVMLSEGQRATITDEITVPTVAAGFVWARAGLITNRAESGAAATINTSVTRVHAFWVEDITDEVNARNSADAALTSASTATAQASLASDHAATAANHASLSANWAAGVSSTIGLTQNANFKTDMTNWFSTTTGTAASATHWQANYQSAAGVFVRETANRYNLYSAQMPVNPLRKYRIRGRFYSGSATVGRVYLGLVCFNNLGALVGYNDGRSYASNYHNVNLSAGWNEIETPVFTGLATNPNIQMVQNFAAGTTGVQLLAYLNFGNETGAVLAVDSFYLEDVTESETAAYQTGIATSQAGIATNQASNASASAAAAASSATLSASQATISTTKADIATTQAATATAQAAAASTSAALAASVATGFLNENSGFDAYPSATVGQFPNGWSAMNGAGHYRVDDGAGYAVRIPSTAATAAAIQYIKYDTPAVIVAAGGWYVLECDIILNSGALDGAGIIFRPLNSSGTQVGSDIPFQFNTSPDNTNGVVGAGAAGRAYSFKKLIQIPASATTTHGYRIRLYSHSSALGSIAAANDITFRKVGFRPANQAEIDVGVVLPDLQATVSTQELAIAEIDSRTAAHVTTVSTGVASAELALFAKDVNGAAASQISLKADAIKLGSITQPVLSIIGGQAYFSGKLNAGTVDAAAINVANLSAISSNLGTIQVTTANIADLSVSTLKIQNQAVTIPVGAYTDAAIAVTNVSTSANPGTVIQSATIASTGAPLKIDFSFAISGDAQVNHRCHIRVRRGTTQILLITDITAGLIEGRRAAISFNFTDNPTAGTHTYYLEVATSIGGSAKNRGLYLLETKK